MMEQLLGMDFSQMVAYAKAFLLIAVVFKALEFILPGLVVGKVHNWLESIRVSLWLKDPAHPKRLAWWVATLELLEEELPDIGQGDGVYREAGEVAAAWVGVGSASRWAAVLRKTGDAMDTEVDAGLKSLAQDRAKAAEPGLADPAPPGAS